MHKFVSLRKLYKLGWIWIKLPGQVFFRRNNRVDTYNRLSSIGYTDDQVMAISVSVNMLKSKNDDVIKGIFHSHHLFEYFESTLD